MEAFIQYFFEVFRN